MILEIYILLQLMALIAFALTFFAKTPLTSVMSMISSGILIAGSWVITTGSRYVYNPAIRAYTEESINVSTGYLPYINMAIFGLSLLFFFYDVFRLASDEPHYSENNAGGKL